MADEAKARGNSSFSSGDFTSAVLHYTSAISLSPTNHILFSNRSGAHASLHNYTDALSDAKKTVELKPDWAKGYSRLGAAHLGLNNFNEAVAAYKKGLEIDPSNEVLKSGLADARASRLNHNRNAFKAPEMWTKLASDPSTRGFLQQPDYVKMMEEIRQSPNNLKFYMKDHRMVQSFEVLLNLKLRGEKSEVEKKQEMKQRAKTAKALGTAAFKKRDFEAAFQHYSTAMENDDEDISYITNRAAVYLQMEKYKECIEDCDKAVERGIELGSDDKMVARALTRKGTAFVKMAKCSKDYEPAIEAYQRALTVHRNDDTLGKLYQAETAKKEWERKEYIDPKIGDEEREKGDELFEKQKYPDAIKQYTEAIKRNPKDPKAYSNRAACYNKLGAFPSGLEDAEKCIEIDPKFYKGYIRKAEVELYLKEFDNAMGTYQKGLKHDPNNQELLDGVTSCIQEMNKPKRGGLTPEELKKRLAKGMPDQEIQNILIDPVIRQVMSDLEENPSAAQKQMQNPVIMSKIQKLISAGMFQMKV